jgi:hypothetical protein
MRSLLLVLIVLFIFGCRHVPPGQIKKQTAPGQIQKNTGYNPASGKIKIK